MENFDFYLMFAGSEEKGSFYLLSREGQCIANIPPCKITKEVVDYLSVWISEPKKTGVVTKNIQTFNTLNQILLRFLDKKKDNFAYGLRGNWVNLFEQMQSPLSKRIARKSMGFYSDKLHQGYPIESELFDMHQLFLHWKNSKDSYLKTVQYLNEKEKNYINNLEENQLVSEVAYAFPQATIKSSLSLSNRASTCEILDEGRLLGEGDTINEAFIQALKCNQKQTTFF